MQRYYIFSRFPNFCGKKSNWCKKSTNYSQKNRRKQKFPNWNQLTSFRNIMLSGLWAVFIRVLSGLYKDLISRMRNIKTILRHVNYFLFDNHIVYYKLFVSPSQLPRPACGEGVRGRGYYWCHSVSAIQANYFTNQELT